MNSAEPAPETVAVEKADPEAVVTPVAGNLHSWVVEDGELVEAGQVVAVIEAMKMETSILAPCAGRLQIGEQPGGYFEAKFKIGRINTAV